MALKYGMMTNPAKDVVKEIKTAQRMGFDYVELGMEIPEGHPDIFMRRRKEVLKALKPFKHSPISHTPYMFELWSDYDEVRKAWIEVAKRSADVSAALGCKFMNIHAPVFGGMYRQSPSHWRHARINFKRSIRDIVKHASDKGLTIILENMDPFGTPFKGYQDIVKSTPGLFVHMDVSHAFLDGGMSKVLKYMRTFRDRIRHVHFSDSLGLEDDHIGIGQGVIDYYMIMEMLKRIGYDRTISLEVYSSRKDLRESLRIVRAIEEDVWSG